MRKKVLVLGSTGSIGTQALEVIGAYPDRFTLVGMAAGGLRPDVLSAQMRSTGVSNIATARPCGLPGLVGDDAAVELIRRTECDVVLNALDGSLGLKPTLEVLRTGATLALANKESLVAGGNLVREAARPGQIVPVDSEHSAIAQCLKAGATSEIAKLVITASGGPFRGKSRAELAHVTPAQAARHPTWSMGQMITLNSATLVNKALEVIEAHLLFDIDYDMIDVTVHPQSVVHSMVTFVDGSTIVKASPPSMKIPIALALDWPNRPPNVSAASDFTDTAKPTEWTFEPVDHQTFPAIELARQAGKSGGAFTAIFNAANEQAARAFLNGKVPFLEIVETIRRVLDSAGEWSTEPGTVEEVLAAESWARSCADRLIGEYGKRS